MTAPFTFAEQVRQALRHASEDADCPPAEREKFHALAEHGSEDRLAHLRRLLK